MFTTKQRVSLCNLLKAKYYTTKEDGWMDECMDVVKRDFTLLGYVVTEKDGWMGGIHASFSREDYLRTGLLRLGAATQ